MGFVLRQFVLFVAIGCHRVYASTCQDMAKWPDWDWWMFAENTLWLSLSIYLSGVYFGGRWVPADILKKAGRV